MKKIFIILLAVVFIILGFLSVNDQEDKDGTVLQIENTRIDVMVADSEAERIQGLSRRESLLENEGMLFIFPNDDFHAIWMKEMKFPIDIVWLDKDLRIVDVKKSARPESYPEIFKSKKPARYVLELNAGFTDKYSIKEGDTARLLLGR